MAFYVDRLGFTLQWEETSDGRAGITGVARGGIELTVDCPMCSARVSGARTSA